MLCVDVNVLVYAYDPQSPHRQKVLTWLESAVNGADAIAIPMVVASGFLRLVTNRRVFPTPTTPAKAIAFLDWLLDLPRTFVPTTTQKQYEILRGLVLQQNLTANEVPDAALAAIALDLDAVFVTSDKGFARFAGLRLLDPLDL